MSGNGVLTGRDPEKPEFVREDPVLRLAGVIRESIGDGPGIRFTVFCQGCPHGCPGCHNQSTHDFRGGTDTPVSRILQAVDENPLLAGVTFSGGEPACQPGPFAELARQVHKRGMDVWMYSGYTLEELQQMALDDPALAGLIAEIDVLVDGRYLEAQRDLTLNFRGSANQRLIDMKASREAGTVVLYKEE